MSLEHTVCDHCAVNNMPERSVCWNCGTPLPVSYGPDGHHAAVAAARKAAAVISQAEINALLDRASVVDAVGEEKQLKAARAAEGTKMMHEAGRPAGAGNWLSRVLRLHST
jgi:hypothetical protein